MKNLLSQIKNNLLIDHSKKFVISICIVQDPEKKWKSFLILKKHYSRLLDKPRL
jgi:hypothetical protein